MSMISSHLFFFLFPEFNVPLILFVAHDDDMMTTTMAENLADDLLAFDKLVLGIIQLF